MNPDAARAVKDAVLRHRDEAVGLLQELVRIPSVNHPPTGDEKAVQEFYAGRLAGAGMEVDLFEAASVPGFGSHPGRLKEHDMAGRPDVVGVLRGSGGGRSLLLFAHADVEQPGEPSHWTGGDPFSGALRDGRVYGRGTGDDKCGMAIAAMVPRVLASAGLRLKGDLLAASVSDEEQGGSNGIVALLAKGYRADAGVNLDGADQRICTSSLGGGGGTVHLRVPGLQADAGALLEYFKEVSGKFMLFREARERKFSGHPHYDLPVFKEYAVRMYSVCLSGLDDPAGGTFRTFLSLLPGEEAAGLQEEFEEAIAAAQGGECRVEWMSRFLPPSNVAEEEPLVEVLASSLEQASGRTAGVGGSCMGDTGMVDRYGGFPCVIFGPGRGFGTGEGSAHQADEFVEVDEFMISLETVALAAVAWCGLA